MPYSGISDSKLPKYVKNRSDKLKKGWVAVFNQAYNKYGEEKAFIMANAWLKKQVSSKKFIKRSIITLQAEGGKHFIQRDANGDEYISFVLSTNMPHKDGRQFTEENLKEWAEYINANPIIGDIDHQFYDYILKAGVSDEAVVNLLKNKKGIAKSVKAAYEKGKLWVKAIIDKRYKRLVDKSRGVSVEAVCDMGKDNWDLLGFTFNVNTTPADAAGVAA